MTVNTLYDTLRERGASLEIEDGRLRVRASRGVVTAELQAQIAAHRDALVALIAAEADPHAPFPLTDMQEAYLVGRSAAFPLGEVACHLYHELDAPVALDAARLEQAWKAVIARHAALRTRLRPDGLQEVLETAPPWSLPVHDLRAASPEEAEARLAATRQRLADRCNPPQRWPSFAVELSLLPSGGSRAHVDVDLMFVDAAGMIATLGDWGALYRDLDVALPPLRGSFRDAVRREHAARATPAWREAEAWWTQRLETLPAAPELPTARAPEGMLGVSTRRHAGRLDGARWASFCQRAAAEGLTPSGAVCAVYAEVLAAWSGARPFTLDLTLFRTAAEQEGAAPIVGEFTTTVLLEVDPSPPTFAARARALRDRLAADLEHAAASGVAAQRAYARRTGESRAFPVVFTSVLGHSRGGVGEEELGWLGEIAFCTSQTPQVWIDGQVRYAQGALQLSWDVPEGLFPPGLIEDAFAAFLDLLRLLSEDEAAWARGRFDLLPEGQRARREAYNRTAGPLPSGRIFDGFRARVDAAPDALAVRAGDGVLSYAALDRRASQISHALGPRAPGEPVVVCLPRGVDQVAAVLGVLGAGGAYVPLDVDWPPARLVGLSARCGAAVVLTSAALAGLGWPAGVRVLTVEETRGAPETRLAAPQQPEDRAYIIHTSGSTGEPKGVVISHAAALNTLVHVNARFAVGPGDRVLSVSSLAFDLSVYDLFGVLGAGGALVLPDADRARDVLHWLDLIQAHGVTIWNSVPALFELLVDAAERRGRPPGALRAVLLSGDWIPVDLPDRGRAIWPAADVHSLGGATEAAIWSIAHPTEGLAPGATSVPYGRPLTNQRFYALDARQAPSPEWVPGELYIGGAGLAEGYWLDPVRTAERFFAHPETGERLYRTGDQGRFLPDGVLEFLGRLDQQVKINGHRVELGEIEAALRSTPGVRDAVVTAPGARGRRRLVAYVVPSEAGAALPEAALQARLAERLPASMVPRVYVALAALPLTANGKVDRGRLPAPPAGDPAPSRAPAQAGLAAVDRVLAVIAEVLPALAVGPEDDLIRQGANSIDLIRLATRLNEVFGARPPMAEILKRGSASELARFYEDAQAEAPVVEAAPALLVDPAAREALKAQRLGLRRLEGEGRPLWRPREEEAHGPTRRSQRVFSPRPFAAEALGRWLSALCPVEEGGRLRYRYASAGGSYALRTYIFVASGRVSGLAGGGYYHDPIGHRLMPLPGAGALPPDVHAPTNRPWAEDAPVLVFLVAARSAVEPLYGGRWRDFALIEAGEVAQLLEEGAGPAGLGACQLGELRVDRVAAALALDPDEVLLHALAAGAVAFEEDVI